MSAADNVANMFEPPSTQAPLPRQRVRICPASDAWHLAARDQIRPFRSLSASVRSKVRTHGSEPEAEGRGDGYDGHEGVGATVVTGGDALPVFETGTQVLDFVPLAIEQLLIGVLDLAIGRWRDAWGDAAAGKGVVEPVAVVALVSQQFLGLG